MQKIVKYKKYYAGVCILMLLLKNKECICNSTGLSLGNQVDGYRALYIACQVLLRTNLGPKPGPSEGITCIWMKANESSGPPCPPHLPKSRQSDRDGFINPRMAEHPTRRPPNLSPSQTNHRLPGPRNSHPPPVV